MQFKFDPNQEYQVRAIESVANLLEGQPRTEADLSFALGAGFAAMPNRLDLDEEALLANLQNVQRENALPVDDSLQLIEEAVETAADEKRVRFANFSVEMETGTGKTYVYLRTALELYRRYGLRKFIVVVPSVAVREGVLKTLKVTEKHLRELYGNVPYRYHAYDSANLSQVRQFALSDGVEIMVMTIDSFNKASNVIRQSTDRLQGETPIHLVQAARPILILDEPQNMESELRVRALAALDPLFALRYSATHRNVERLQSEIEDEYGKEGLPPKPANARRRGVARLRKEYTLRPEFKELWEKIKHKTRYAVHIDTERLIEEVVRELDRTTIAPPRVTITKAQVRVEGEAAFEAVQTSATRTAMELRGQYAFPNLVALMEHLLQHTAPPVRLTRRTLLEIFRRTAQKQAALDNPHGFATETVRIIKEKLADQLINGIQYEKINEWYEMTQFEGEIESWEEYLVPVERSVYDHVMWESEVERRFAEDLDRREDVRLFLKLPSWFTVPTPVGEYNPDWAIVMEDRDEHGEPTGRPLLYLVRETKDTTDRSKLRPDERRKIECGERHFEEALGVDYRVVTQAGELP